MYKYTHIHSLVRIMNLLFCYSKLEIILESVAVNVALKKMASQSSTHFPIIPINSTCKFNFSASLAVDGNNNQHERILCAQTQIENNPKWKVDLGKKYNISQMRIYNNKNCK